MRKHGACFCICRTGAAGTVSEANTPRRDKKRKDSTIPIYLRITIDGKRAEFAINRFIDEDKWDAKSGYAIGTKESARSLNTYIDVLRSQVYDAQRELVQEKEHVTAEAVKNRILGKDKQSKTLLEVFRYHNKIVGEQVGKGYASLTQKRYETAMMHVSSFLQHAYQKQDIDLQSLNHEFVTRFEHYLKTVRNCNPNTTAKRDTTVTLTNDEKYYPFLGPFLVIS